MHGIVLSPELWIGLLVMFAFAPLLLLLCLRFVRDTAHRSLFASFVFFLPMLLMAGFFMLTNESADGPIGLKEFSVGLFMLLSVWAAFAGVLSLRRGMECVGTYRLALLWMIPEGLVCLWIGFLFLQPLLDRILRCV